jgi:hypothetical protein
MALRILSGMIFIPRGGTKSGSVEISFNPFALTVASNSAFELRKRREIGPRERFVRRPASIVAARQFDIVTILGDAGNYRGRINDTVTRDSITISWNAPAGRVDQEEIPFMIVGEVPVQPAPVFLTVRRPGDGLTPVRPGDELPSDLLSRRRSRARGARKKK